MTGTACLSSRWPQAPAPHSRSAAHCRRPPCRRPARHPYTGGHANRAPHSRVRTATRQRARVRAAVGRPCGGSAATKNYASAVPARDGTRLGDPRPHLCLDQAVKGCSPKTRERSACSCSARTRIVRSWRRTDTAPGPSCDAADVAKREALATVVQPFAAWFLAHFIATVACAHW